ncbi:glycerol-3-phosphate dehydrogenase [Chitinimonas arctica]|uniref:Glycerol-3-phosphate dehydrogenase n=1 Tax=Chitinimonas arctica TaxID=2594795 RepID=A0A516SES9_9NEIS|nr:glycerol-3-phosphate dehydrogenase [Chitinimonas arctica]QDQ26651.1 glycerol-3-phosphate dehydrogenase [Chitinimonas arctica]
MTAKSYDLLVVGGGINGAGIANHAAQAGLNPLLVEQGDLAGATSSASSKLIHGGLRYLEQRQFRLVRESLGEREVLLKMAPHLVRPLSFVLPHHAGLRPAWLIRLGLFCYDHLGGRERLPTSYGINLRRHAWGEPLQPAFRKGFVYADCWADDARLVLANALQCQELGGTVRTRTRLELAHREGRQWRAELRSATGQSEVVYTRALVNAAGPWVEQVLKQRLRLGARDSVKMVKGSHIVVPALHPGPQAYILQHQDGRIVFVLPYEGRFSLIGTTDIVHDGDPGEVHCSDAEVSYLCELVGQYFQRPPTPEQVVWRFAGVRPLYDDRSENPSAITRDYTLRLDREGAPVLSVFGGKLTTYRQLARHAMQSLQPYFDRMRLPDNPTTLVGGDLPGGDFEAFLQDARLRYGELEPDLLLRLARQFGDRLHKLLAGVRDTTDLGQHFGAGLYEREVRYLQLEEWAVSAEDILWRRTKRGLHMSAAEQAALVEWMAGSQRYSAGG